jgi:hypothetical protein
MLASHPVVAVAADGALPEPMAALTCTALAPGTRSPQPTPDRTGSHLRPWTGSLATTADIYADTQLRACVLTR